MVLEADDIVATFDQLRSNGVRIVDEPKQQPWGWWEYLPIRTATATACTSRVAGLTRPGYKHSDVIRNETWS